MDRHYVVLSSISDLAIQCIIQCIDNGTTERLAHAFEMPQQQFPLWYSKHRHRETTENSKLCCKIYFKGKPEANTPLASDHR